MRYFHRAEHYSTFITEASPDHGWYRDLQLDNVQRVIENPKRDVSIKLIPSSSGIYVEEGERSQKPEVVSDLPGSSSIQTAVLIHT